MSTRLVAREECACAGAHGGRREDYSAARLPCQPVLAVHHIVSVGYVKGINDWDEADDALPPICHAIAQAARPLPAALTAP